MIDLGTDFLGLELDCPLVPSSSPLSRHLDYARQLEDSGAGALVMYSLFEEDLADEEERLARFGLEQGIGHHEAEHFLPVHHDFISTLDAYLEQLHRLKEALDIPVIASLNGTTISHWLDHGRELEEAGADAVELNIYYIAARLEDTAESVEARYVGLVEELVRHVGLPVSVKLSPQFSALPNLVKRLESAGCRGVALFNRFYQPDINLEDLEVAYRLTLSTSRESLLAMRWIALLYGRVGLSLAATGGIHTAADALKVIAAGASAAYLCSSLLIPGPGHLARIREDMVHWLQEHEYESMTQLRGSMSQLHAPDPAAYERANYSKTLGNFRLSTRQWK